MNQKKTSDTSRIFNTVVSIFASGLTLGGIAMGGWYLFYYRNHEQTNDAQIEQYVTPVMGRVTGYVQTVNYQDNSYVHKGDTLIQLDPREYRAKLDMAYADFQNALKNENVITKKAQTSQSSVAIHQAQLTAAKTKVWEKEKEYQRQINLLKEEASTEQRVENAKALLDAAQSNYQELLEKIHTTQLMAQEANSEIPFGNTIIQQKKASLDNARLFYSYTTITAPYDGWVGKRTIQPGQLIKEGQTLVAVVSKEKWMVANFKETQIRYLKVGQLVEFKADVTADKIWHGRIISFSPASGARFSLLPPDNATGNFVKIEQRVPVKISILETSDRAYTLLRAGLNVEVFVAH